MRRFLILFILGAAVCLAEPITSSLFACSITPILPQGDSTPCGLNGTFGYPPVQASASGDMTYGLGAGVQFSANGSVQSYGTEGGSKPGDCCGLQGLAAASLSWSDTLETDGPLRPGWILYSIGSYGFSVDGAAHSDVEFGPYFQDGSKGGPMGDLPGNCFNNCLEPFILGGLFSVSIMLSTEIYGGDIGGAEASGSLTFSLYESDGVTPVLVQEAPEPGSLMLAGIGLLGLFKVTATLRAPRSTSGTVSSEVGDLRSAMKMPFQ